MQGRWRRIMQDIRRRRDIDAYVVSALALVLALLTVLPIPGEPEVSWGDQARWAVTLAALAVLVFRSVTPPGGGREFGAVAEDRSAFDSRPLPERWRATRELCIFAPSAVNILSSSNLEILRRTVLARPDGRVRVVVIDRDAASVATRQLDALEVPSPSLPSSLDMTLEQLEIVTTWAIPGRFEYRLLDYNPGFSLVGTDPDGRSGTMIVEFHGFANHSTGSRMHLELTRAIDDRWYAYWWYQFETIWNAATPALAGSSESARSSDSASRGVSSK